MVEHSAAAIERLDDFHDRVTRDGATDVDDAPFRERVEARRGQFHAALADDLNSAGALGALFELLREANAAYDEKQVGAAAATALQSFLDEADSILGVGRREKVLLDADIEALIEEREQARASKDFARSDSIRDELKERGIHLEDSPTGVRWKRR